MEEIEISRVVISAYHEELLDRLVSDAIIVGAGPSGMMAAYCLAKNGLKVTLLKKRLSPGGGIWGGGRAMPEAVVQEDAFPLLDEVGIRRRPQKEGSHAANAIELAAGLCFKAVQAGAVVFNLMAPARGSSVDRPSAASWRRSPVFLGGGPACSRSWPPSPCVRFAVSRGVRVALLSPGCSEAFRRSSCQFCAWDAVNRKLRAVDSRTTRIARITRDVGIDIVTP